MLKKLLIATGVIFAIIAVVLIVAGVIVYLKVDKAFVSSQMAKALNRQVSIEKIDISILSVLSGIEVKNVVVSNFKTPPELANLQGKPVAEADVFASMETLRFKVKILPLLGRHIELKELVLYRPVINLSRDKQGVMNIDDLIKSKKPADKEKKGAPQKEPSRPISADDIPVAIAVGEIGMKNGTVNYYDGEYDQKIQIYKLTVLAYDIAVDPQNLANKDEMKVKLDMGMKTVGALKSGSVEHFDVTLNAAGRVIPFDVKTRLLEPEAILHVVVPEGEITGLQLLGAVAAVPILGDYLGEHLRFLKDKQQWKGSGQNGLDLHYKQAKAEITNGRLSLKDADILFDGGMNIDTKALDLNLNLLLAKEVNEAVRATLAQKIEALAGSDVKKYADPGRLAGIAMTPLINKDGRIDLKAKVSGTTKKPDVIITQPPLGSLGSLVQDQAGSLAVEAGKSAARQLLKDDQKKVLEDIEGLFKKK